MCIYALDPRDDISCYTLGMITITRDSGYADRLRKYKVLLDDVEIGEISNGETKSFEVAPGEHILQLKIDWACSNEVNFAQKNNESLKFEVSSPVRGLRIIFAVFYGTIFSNRYLNLKRIV